jgi:15-cis-phytoene synthase
MRKGNIAMQDRAGIANIEQVDCVSATVIQPRSLPPPGDSDERFMAIHGRTFHFAARFLPPELRQHVVTLYAFFRALDDLVDKPPRGRQLADIREELEDWQRWFVGDLSAPAPQQATGVRLAVMLTEYRIPRAIFLDFLAGIASDLEPREIATFAELHCYCYRVAGTVGLAMAYLLGASSKQALAAAESLGIAMQLTNILRDVGSDLAAGRIYLPQDELERFGCSRALLLQLSTGQLRSDDHFRDLIRFQIARTHRYYARGMAGIWLLPTDCRLPILVAGRLYRRILTVIERKDYAVFHSRAATSFPEKAREATIAFVLARLWKSGEAYFSTEEEALLEN